MKRSIYTLLVLVFACTGTAFGQTEVYLNAGSATEAVFNGQAHLGDVNLSAYYSGGTSYTNDTYNPETIFDSEAYSTEEAGTLSYEFPVPNGSYTVTTYHNELWFGEEGRAEGPGLRVFDIRIESILKKDDYDIYMSNNNNPESLTFPGITVNDGQLTVDIDASVQSATLHAVAIQGEGALVGTDFYINIGSDKDLDHEGNLFISEHKTGHNSLKTFSYTGASTEPLFQTERFSDATIDTLSYKIEVPNGTYTIKTHHNELYFGKHPHAIQNNLPSAQGNRVFDIMVEGSLLVDDFDLFDHGDSDYTHTFTSIVVSDGILNIDLPSQVNNATMSGIAIEQTSGGTTALYYNTGGSDVSYNGHTYLSDTTAFISSNSSYAHEYILPIEPLLTTERFGETGSLDYTIPLDNGVYTVVLHHNELYFGKKISAPSAQAGRRVFDISLEGTLVKDDFDIYTESYNYPTTLTFTGVMVTDGTLNINMVASADHPQLSGLTITQETPYNIPALSQDQNYIFTRTYQKEVDNFDPTTVTDHDIMEQVTYYDGLGRPKQQIALEATKKYIEISDFPSVSGWQNDWTIGSGSTGFYNQNGHTNENQRIQGTDPYGNSSLLWEGKDNDTISSGDGGWNTDYISIDNTKTYRYTTWIKKTGSHDGNSYHGTQNVLNLSDGTPNSNPYFWTGDVPQLDTWYLLVGVVHPYGYSGGDSGISGVYDLSGNKVMDATEFTWDSTTVNSRFRNYLFYATDPNVRQYFYGPVLQILDGSENTLDEIIGSDHTLKDLVTHIEYDPYGRQNKDWLPYQAVTGGAGSYRGDISFETKEFYKTTFPIDFPGPNDGLGISLLNPYAQTEFEASPLNRPIKRAAPGDAWKMGNGHEIEYEHSTNTTGEVKLFRVHFINPTTSILVQTTDYAAGELYKTITKDENHSGTSKDHTVEEFRDKQGRVILKRTYENELPHDTWYVYDYYGNNRFIIPPLVDTSDGVSATELDELCYQYIYDQRNRLTEKKSPGKDWEYIVYNSLNQPVLTQDANLRTNNQWLFTKYDAFGRVAYTGIYTHGSTISRLDMVIEQNTFYQNNPGNKQYEQKNTDTSNYFYSKESFPNTNLETLTLNYYDNYSFDLAGLSLPATDGFGQSIINHDNTSLETKGLATGSKVKVLGTSQWITTLSGYDTKRRPVYVVTKNEYLLTTDIVESELDFAGRTKRSKTTHQKTGNTDIVTLNNMSYDHYSRLTALDQELDNEVEQLVVNTYDNLGQLVQKKVGNTLESPLQTVDYTYNIRGWLTQINDANELGNDLFGFAINYNLPTQNLGSTVALYNGNISETIWKTASDQVQRAYGYKFDALNRLTKATGSDTHYNLGMVDYDKNGNITQLQRNGHRDVNVTSFGLMDDLTYTYQGNQLTAVDDDPLASAVTGFIDGTENATEYTYDNNGNLLTDTNKGITGMLYNHLNLPVQVSINGGTISYVYTAIGTKLRKTLSTGEETTYANGVVYQDGALQFFPTQEGYITPDGAGGWKYVYQFKDHLDNVRLSYADIDTDPASINLEIIEENNYYPFGLKMRGINETITSSGNSIAQKWKYNGIELEQAFDFNVYEMDLRQYDPALARWTGMDPVLHESMSPYNAFDNNPVYWADPSGADARNMPNSSEEYWDVARNSPFYNYDRTRIIFAENGNNSSDCCPTPYNGSGVAVGDNVVNTLSEVTVTGINKSSSAGAGLANTGGVNFGDRVSHPGVEKPSWMSTMDYGPWRSSFNGSLDDYNADFGTNYSNSNEAYGDWLYATIYFPEAKARIQSMHAAQTKVGVATLATPLIIIGAVEALPILATAMKTSSVSSLSYGTMFRHGAYRLTVRNSLGRFATGNGTSLLQNSGRVFFQRYGLNGLGQATRTSPVIPPNWSTITRWTVGSGLSAGVGYYYYNKLFD